MRKWAVALLAAAGVVGALAAREAWQRRQDGVRYDVGRRYWRKILRTEDVRWAEAQSLGYRIPSNTIGIHLDVYPQAASDAPVLVLAHGLLTYGKLLIPLARAFFEQGYTVICPDNAGNGFSGGVRGGQTVGEAAAVLVDATIWARQRFDGPIYLMGLSLGGALAYAAAAAGAPVSAISCLDLFTFDDPRSLRELVARPETLAILPALRPLAALLGWVRVPVEWVHRIEESVAPEERDQIQVLLADPLPPRQITLRALISATTTPPAVPLEHNTVPVLVLNQELDRVLSPAVTRTNFARLGGPKRYVELPGRAHWSMQPEFWAPIVAAADAWFHEHRPRAVALRQAQRAPVER